MMQLLSIHFSATDFVMDTVLQETIYGSKDLTGDIQPLLEKLGEGEAVMAGGGQRGRADQQSLPKRRDGDHE